MCTDIILLKASELPDLFIDALVTDQTNRLLFLSAWGSEAQTQQLRADLSLPNYQAGALERLTLQCEGTQEPIFYPRVARLVDKNRFDTRVGRPMGDSLFAHLTQVWVYDKRSLSSDDANNSVLLLRQHSEPADVFQARTWQMVQALSRTPLHSSWHSLMSVFQDKGWVTYLDGFAIDACAIELPTDEVANEVMQQVQQGVLTLPVMH